MTVFSSIKKSLGFAPGRMSLRTELVAAVTTFLTMCYILAVNPAVLASTGMDKGALFTATALVSALATLLIAFLARLPLAQAPSMGLNAFFAYTLCATLGLTWQQALAVVLIEGIAFLLLTFLDIHEKILRCIPQNLHHAITAGLGLFIAFIGLKNADIIVADEATFVRLGRFTPVCLLGLVSILLCGVLMVRGVKGALFIGIVVSTLVGLPLGVTQVPEGWVPLAAPQSIEPICLCPDFAGIFTPRTLMAAFSLLLVNVFDMLGTLVALAEKMGIVGADGKVPRLGGAMLSTALGTSAGALLGCSPVNVYVENASGIAEGARSGLAALCVGLLFVLSVFLAPLFLLIPVAATSGALFIVGVLMAGSFTKLRLDDLSEAFPAFTTVITMLLCYSISDGICLGLLSYVLIKAFTGRFRELNVTLCVLALLIALNYAFG